jgi:hypothetical protein
MPAQLTVDYCLLCEDARPEVGNKLTILGFFGVLPGAQLLIADLMAPSRLLFLFGAKGRAGRVTATCQILTPDGGLHFASVLEGEFDPTKKAILGTGVFGPLLKEGDFRVRLLVAGESVYEAEFNVKQGIVP